MNDLNGTALSALAAALAPHLVAELAKLGGNGGNPVTQNGGGFGAGQQTGTQPLGNPGLAGGLNVGQQMQNPAQNGNVMAQNNPFGQPQAQQQQAAPTITPDAIQQLISPLVQNEQIKAALQEQMRQMGIVNLPDATPAQLPELFQRFSTVRDQAQAAGLIPAQGQQQAVTSLV